MGVDEEVLDDFVDTFTGEKTKDVVVEQFSHPADNIETTITADFCDETLIQPIVRRDSLSANQGVIDGVTLDEYKQAKKAVAVELHDDLAETLEELRKSQEMLDQLAADMSVERAKDVVAEVINAEMETAEESEQSCPIDDTLQTEIENETGQIGADSTMDHSTCGGYEFGAPLEELVVDALPVVEIIGADSIAPEEELVVEPLPELVFELTPGSQDAIVRMAAVVESSVLLSKDDIIQDEVVDEIVEEFVEDVEDVVEELEDEVGEPASQDFIVQNAAVVESSVLLPKETFEAIGADSIQPMEELVVEPLPELVFELAPGSQDAIVRAAAVIESSVLLPKDDLAPQNDPTRPEFWEPTDEETLEAVAEPGSQDLIVQNAATIQSSVLEAATSAEAFVNDEVMSDEITISEHASDLEDVSDIEDEKEGRKDSVEDELDIPSPVELDIPILTPVLRPDEPSPTAETPSVIANTPSEIKDDDQKFTFSEVSGSQSPMESEPGDCVYDYVEEDLEPGNDVNELIEANRSSVIEVINDKASSDDKVERVVDELEQQSNDEQLPPRIVNPTVKISTSQDESST